MKKTTIILSVFLIVGIALILMATSVGRSNISDSPVGRIFTAAPDTIDTDVRTITIVAKNWEFEPNVVRVKRGERVSLRIKSVDVKHEFSLPEYNLRATVQPLQTTVVQFTPDKSGQFEFTCTLNCGPGNYTGMKGVLIVQ